MEKEDREDGVTIRDAIGRNQPTVVTDDRGPSMHWCPVTLRNALSAHVEGVNEMGTPGGIQKVIFINESGLYALANRARPNIQGIPWVYFGV